MEQTPTSTVQLPLLAMAGMLLVAALAAVFYGWYSYGSSIILSLADNGLSWCF